MDRLAKAFLDKRVPASRLHLYSTVETTAIVRFVVSYETVPANGEAVVVDFIYWGANDRRGV